MTIATPTRMKEYKNKETLEKLYVEQRLSTTEIAEKVDCSSATVWRWLKKHEIERRSRGDSIREKFSTKAPKMTMDSGGHTGFIVQHKKDRFWLSVHRLTMVAEYGFDSVCGKVVHHKNEIPWDNRPENLKLMDESNHRSHHNSNRTIEDNNLERDDLGRLKAQ